MTDQLEGLNDEDPAPPELIPGMPKGQALCSEAGYRFQLQHFRIFDFFLFGLRLSTHADKARFTAAEALAGAGDKEYVANFQKVQQNPQPAFRKLRSFGDYQSEIMIIRSVDNFMSFVSETLQGCMSKKPELLRSKEQIRTEDVLRFSNRRDLVDFLVNRKLNELSYGGLRGIEEFLDQRLNLALVNNDHERTRLSIAIELRNIYTHNRGVVNELFLSRLAAHEHAYKFVQGKRFHADFDEIVGLANNLFDIAIRLDGAGNEVRPSEKAICHLGCAAHCAASRICAAGDNNYKRSDAAMRNSGSKERGDSPSQLIDARIKRLSDWRGVQVWTVLSPRGGPFTKRTSRPFRNASASGCRSLLAKPSQFRSKLRFSTGVCRSR
jgi:hypothetical protein